MPNCSLMSVTVAVALVLMSCCGSAVGSEVAEQVSRSSGAVKMKVAGDSLVLAESIPGKLCFDSIEPGTVVVRSTYEPGLKDTVVYEQGRDYIVDCESGTITRSPMSRISDYSTNVLYGKKDFDHGNFPGYGNLPFFVWVDYETRNGHPFAVKNDQSSLLPKTVAKLNAGGPFKIVAYGDSITAGGEASTESLRYPNLYAAALQKRFPKAQVTLENGATGGDTSANGIARLEEKVLTRKPDLVLVAFGMNDHNKGGVGGVALDTFEQNLVSMIKSIRERTSAEVLLVSTFPPNPDWTFGTHQMDKYAAVTNRVAVSQKCAYADLYSVWMKVLERKDPPSLIANNINHPNDFGHWLYLQALEAVEF